MPSVGADPYAAPTQDPAWATATGPVSEIEDDYDDDPPWSSSAKTIVAILSVLTLLGIGGTVWGLMRAGEERDSADLSTEEVAMLTERATTAEAELVELQTTTRAEINDLTAERDQIQADLDAALADQERSADEIEELTRQRDEIEGELEDLRAALENLDNPFPLLIAPNLALSAIAGNYAPLLTQVSCAGFDFCNNPPLLAQAAISQPGGSVELNAPGLVRINFDVVGGQLFGSSTDQSLVGPCAGSARDVQVLMNLYADEGSVQLDGSITLSGLSASVLIDAAEVAGAPECPRSRVWYQLQLDRLG